MFTRVKFDNFSMKGNSPNLKRRTDTFYELRHSEIWRWGHHVLQRPRHIKTSWRVYKYLEWASVYLSQYFTVIFFFRLENLKWSKVMRDGEYGLLNVYFTFPHLPGYINKYPLDILDTCLFYVFSFFTNLLTLLRMRVRLVMCACTCARVCV